MIAVTFGDPTFFKEMDNLMKYAAGFCEGAQKGNYELLKQIGARAKEILENYIDSNARMDPESLHHVYEWHRTGSPEARLFDIKYSATAGSLSMNATLTQSTSIKDGSRVPFYDKASVMERGLSVTVMPRSAEALRFEDGADVVFTKSPVTIQNPGGAGVAGSFRKIYAEFFEKYFTQSFMESSGLGQRFRNARAFSNNFNQGKRGGRALGIETGYRWITGKGGQ